MGQLRLHLRQRVADHFGAFTNAPRAVRSMVDHHAHFSLDPDALTTALRDGVTPRARDEATRYVDDEPVHFCMELVSQPFRANSKEWSCVRLLMNSLGYNGPREGKHSRVRIIDHVSVTNHFDSRDVRQFATVAALHASGLPGIMQIHTREATAADRENPPNDFCVDSILFATFENAQQYLNLCQQCRTIGADLPGASTDFMFADLLNHGEPYIQHNPRLVMRFRHAIGAMLARNFSPALAKNFERGQVTALLKKLRSASSGDAWRMFSSAQPVADLLCRSVRIDAESREWRGSKLAKATPEHAFRWEDVFYRGRYFRYAFP